MVGLNLICDVLSYSIYMSTLVGKLCLPFFFFFVYRFLDLGIFDYYEYVELCSNFRHEVYKDKQVKIIAYV